MYYQTDPTNRMLEIAASLSATQKTLAGVKYDLWQINVSIEYREAALTPAEGWPGKNEESRKQAKTNALANDSPLAKMHGELARQTKAEFDLTALVGELENERRALEWSIRAGLVAALSGKGERSTFGERSAFGNSSHADPAEAAFDDAALEAVVDKMLIESDIMAEFMDDLNAAGAPELNLPADDLPF